jgi:hypothetical protein
VLKKKLNFRVDRKISIATMARLVRNKWAASGRASNRVNVLGKLFFKKAVDSINVFDRLSAASATNRCFDAVES